MEKKEERIRIISVEPEEISYMDEIDNSPSGIYHKFNWFWHKEEDLKLEYLEYNVVLIYSDDCCSDFDLYNREFLGRKIYGTFLVMGIKRTLDEMLGLNKSTTIKDILIDREDRTRLTDKWENQEYRSLTMQEIDKYIDMFKI